jgi:competence ComEA-like helix-hairpin-helix protein
MQKRPISIALIFLITVFVPFLALAEQIDINSATLKELDLLTGVGSVYAERIINGRPYSSIDDLSKIKGIGPATLQKIKDQGWACVNCQTSLPAPKTSESKSTQFDLPALSTNENLQIKNSANESGQNNPSLQTIFLAGFLSLFSGATVLSIKKFI